MPTRSDASRRKCFPSSFLHRSRFENTTYTFVSFCQRSTACIAILTCMCFVPVIQALPPTNRPTTQPILAPFVQCHFMVCDLRTHYCDEIINSCARCDDDCHISRIGGNPSAVHECQQKCQWYYLFTSTVPPPTQATSAPTLGELAMNSLQVQNAMELDNQSSLMAVCIVLAVTVVLTLALVAIIVLAITVYRFVRKNSPELSRCGSVIAKDTNEHVRSVDDTRLVSPLFSDSDHHTTYVGSSPDVTGAACSNDQTPPASITTANTTGDSPDTKLLRRC